MSLKFLDVVIFYRKAGKMQGLGAGGWGLEACGWRLEAGGWRLEGGGWRLEGGGWRVILKF
jgi:hypothetical protein